MNFIENKYFDSKYLPGLLMLCPRSLHVTVENNLPVQTSVPLNKNHDHSGNIREIFLENIKLSSNLYKM